MHLTVNNVKEVKKMSYAGTKRLAKERPDWIPIVRECLECAREYNEFAGSWVLKRLEEKKKKKIWKPGLRTLVKYGILKRTRTSRGGRRAYYIMPDPEGVERALRELGLYED